MEVKAGFKKYDVNVPVERKIPAISSPVKRLIEQMKDAYVSMGFQEISGPAVESCILELRFAFRAAGPSSKGYAGYILRVKS